MFRGLGYVESRQKHEENEDPESTYDEIEVKDEVEKDINFGYLGRKSLYGHIRARLQIADRS